MSNFAATSGHGARLDTRRIHDASVYLVPVARAHHRNPGFHYRQQTDTREHASA